MNLDDPKLKTICGAHILIVDGKIAKDRTGVLKGERIDILELL